MKEQTIPVSTRLKPLTLARIDAWARVEKRTRCNMISLMLEEYLDAQSGGGKDDMECTYEDKSQE